MWTSSRSPFLCGTVFPAQMPGLGWLSPRALFLQVTGTSERLLIPTRQGIHSVTGNTVLCFTLHPCPVKVYFLLKMGV